VTFAEKVVVIPKELVTFLKTKVGVGEAGRVENLWVMGTIGGDGNGAKEAAALLNVVVGEQFIRG